MASACRRFANGSSLSSIRSAVKCSFRSPLLSKSPSSPFQKTPKSDSPSLRRISFARRHHSELGCLESLLPLHSAVSAARLTSCLSTTSRSCRALSQGTLCCTSPGL